jgi:dihydroorotate dehydrogenase
VWRDDRERSTHNRVGLRNPGAAAAAAFLGAHRTRLPAAWGVSLAVSPGIDDPDESAAQLRDAATAFERAAAGPSWYTLNLSCPNTEDDPAGLQTADLARHLVGAVAEIVSVPLWVKVGPALSVTQYDVLVDVLSDAGVRVVVATNTLASQAPTGSLSAGLGGAPLRPHALSAVRYLAEAIARRGSSLDVVGSGGVLEGRDLAAFLDAGAKAAMLYSALVFRGPLAPALILRESARGA